MTRNKKGFTLVELVIVIAVIAILAGVMIAVFSGVVKRANESAELQKIKNEELAQKADDILKKVDNANWFSWEDFENSLAEKLTETYKKYANQGGNVTAEQVEKAVKNAISEYAANTATQNTSLTEAQVKAIVENALAKASLGGVTESQVRTIVNTAVAGVNTVSKAQVQSIVDAAVAKGLTADQVAQVIATSSLAKASDVTALSTKVDTVIAALNGLDPLTAADLEDKIIELLPVTKKAANATEFTELVGRLNSGSTIVVDWDASAESLTIDETAGDKTLTIKGNKIGTLTINAPQATIYLLADVDTVDVQATAKNSFHILGKVKTLTVNSGRVVLESGSSVQSLTAAPAQSQWVIVEIEEDAEITTELVAEYQKHASETYDYIEIVNKGDINVSKLTLATVTQGTTVTTNVVITNVNEAKSGNAGDPSQSTLNVVSEIEDTDVGLAVDGTNYVVVIQEDTSVIKPGTGTVVPVENGVAKIGSVVFDNVYDALKVVPFDDNETLITIIGDCGITSNAGYTVHPKQNIILDLNGHTLGSMAEAASTAALITNNGTLTIKDSTDTAKNGSGNGLLTTNSAQPDMQSIPGYASNTITNHGVLTIESGSIYCAGEGYACFAIDTYSNNGYNTKLTINGGSVTTNVASSIRQAVFTNTTNDVVINGGVVGSYWIQNYGSNNKAKSAKGTLIINDVEALYGFRFDLGYSIDYSYNIIGDEIIVEIYGGNFKSLNVYSNNNAKTDIVMGGTFTSNVSAYCAEGYFAKSVDGKYAVKPLSEATDEDFVAYVGNVGYLAFDLAKAAANGQAIKLNKDLRGYLMFNDGGTYTLDLNGHDIVNYSGSGNSDTVNVYNSTNLTITDTSSGTKGTISSEVGVAIWTGSSSTDASTITVNGGVKLVGSTYSVQSSDGTTTITINEADITGEFDINSGSTLNDNRA